MTTYPQDLLLDDIIIDLIKKDYQVIMKTADKEKKFYSMNTKDKEIYLVNYHSDGDKVDALESCIKKYNL